MATQETEWVTAVDDDGVPGIAGNPAINTRSSTGIAPDDDPDGGVNAARQARTAGAAGFGQAQTGQTEGDSFDQAKAYAKDMAGRAKEQGRAMFDEQKDTAAGTVDSAANAFRHTAQQLRGDGQAQTGQYVDMLADQLQSLGSRLRSKNLDALLRDAEDFGRRSPGTLLAGSMVAGFVLARFLKSSADRQHAWTEQPYQPSSPDSSFYAEERARAASHRSSASRHDGGALLRDGPYAANPEAARASDADTSGSVMEGSEAGAMRGTATASPAGMSGVAQPMAGATPSSLSGGSTYDQR